MVVLPSEGSLRPDLLKTGGGEEETEWKKNPDSDSQPDSFVLFLLNRNMNLLPQCSCWGRVGVGGCREDLSLHWTCVCTQGCQGEHAEWGGGWFPETNHSDQIWVISQVGHGQICKRKWPLGTVWNRDALSGKTSRPCFSLGFTIASRAFWSCPAQSHFRRRLQQR